jgi:hypothetical protein
MRISFQYELCSESDFIMAEFFIPMKIKIENIAALVNLDINKILDIEKHRNR